NVLFDYLRRGIDGAAIRYHDLVWWACLFEQAVEQFVNRMLFIPHRDNNADFHVRDLPELHRCQHLRVLRLARRFLQLPGDPMVGNRQSFLQRNRRFPIQNFAQARVVAVPTSDALRFRHVVALADSLAGDLRDHAVLAQVDRFAMIAVHEAINPFDAIVDVTIRTRLFAVAPNFDVVAVLGQSDLAADRGGRLLASPVVSSQRTEDVVKPDDARVQAEVFGVVTADALHVELLPTVTVFGVGRVRVFFSERTDVSFALLVTRIDARARSVEITFDAVETRRFDRVEID